MSLRKKFRERYNLKRITKASLAMAIEDNGYREIGAFNANHWGLAKWSKCRTYSVKDSVFYSDDSLIKFLMSDNFEDNEEQ